MRRQLIFIGMTIFLSSCAGQVSDMPKVESLGIMRVMQKDGLTKGHSAADYKGEIN